MLLCSIKCFLYSTTPLQLYVTHLSYKADTAWQHWLPSFSAGLFSKAIISHQIPSSYSIGIKAGGTELKFFLSSISHYCFFLPLLSGTADVLRGLPFFLPCALLCPLQACLVPLEISPAAMAASDIPSPEDVPATGAPHCKSVENKSLKQSRLEEQRRKNTEWARSGCRKSVLIPLFH